MRVARVRIERFRGFEGATLVFPANAVLAGEPQAGRTDIVEALRRVLDPRSTRSRINPLDIHRPTPDCDAPLTEVEVTLLDLGEELEALLSESLETFDANTGEVAGQTNAVDAVLGVRLCYRARYDADTDTGDHWVDFAARSDPAANVFARVGRMEREALPVQFIDNVPALQLRAEGALRALLADADPEGLDTALMRLDQEVHAATSSLTSASVVSQVLTRVIESGPQDLFGIENSGKFEFLPDDGSLAALLRALQPAVSMNAAGPLPVRSQGSTLQYVLSAAEAVSAAASGDSGLVLIGDDFGDGMDASSSEHMARLVHATASQTILTTRRPEVVRAFDPEELIRLSTTNGERRQHRLAKTETKGERIARRLVLEQLLAALSARTVVLVEGPLDAEGYGAIAARLFRKTKNRSHSLSGNGLRLVSPPGPEGGITRLPAIAEVALLLGFHVRAIVDNDKPGSEDPAVAVLESMTEQLIVLPMRTAVEAALIRGVDGAALRTTTEALSTAGMPELPAGMADGDIAEHLISSKIVKKQGLVAAWAHAVTKQPPIARAVIEAVCSDSVGRIDISVAP